MLGHVLADAGQLTKFLGILANVFDALVQAVKELGHFFVAAIAPDDGAVNLEQLRCLAQNSGDFFVFHFFPIGRINRLWSANVNWPSEHSSPAQYLSALVRATLADRKTSARRAGA